MSHGFKKKSGIKLNQIALKLMHDWTASEFMSDKGEGGL